jgi:uncharacterized membrane protein YphA (DoxX/SURF4 family)
MNKRTIAYWVATALTAFVFLSGGAVDVARLDMAVEGITHLGYPVYFMVILGVWKILGGIAVLLPKTPRLKEWAYAGMFLNLSSAAISHTVIGDGIKEIVIPLIILAIAAASWVLRPANRVLGMITGQ